MRQLLPLALLLITPPAFGATLTVQILGIEDAVGEVRVVLCNKSFDVAGCPFGQIIPAMMPGFQVQFTDVQPGSYALAVYHDRDGDGELSRNGLGLPTEPYGFSNDVGRLAPPSFDAARFLVRGDTSVEIIVKPLFGGRVGS